AGWIADLTRSGTAGTLLAVFSRAVVAPGDTASFVIEMEMAGPTAGAFDVTAVAGAAFDRGCDGARPATGEQRVTFRVDALNAGEVKILEGPRGWVNARRGESATIQVRPTTAGRITVRIWDERGMLVRELVRDAGSGSTEILIWDGADAAGRKLPPGLYPVLIEAPGIRYRD